MTSHSIASATVESADTRLQAMFQIAFPGQAQARHRDLEGRAGSNAYKLTKTDGLLCRIIKISPQVRQLKSVSLVKIRQPSAHLLTF
jgi:hypothetical protein